MSATDTPNGAQVPFLDPASDARDLASLPPRVWDAVVVGAGPAGSLSALRLARAGLATLLVDKARFPRGKVCGCCLNARALAALDAAGLGDLPARLGARPLRDVQLAAGGRSATLRLAGGVSLSRDALDAALMAAARDAGAIVLTSVHAHVPHVPRVARAPGEPGDSTRRVLLRGAHDATAAASRAASTSLTGAFAIEARVIIAADGLGGRLLHDGADGEDVASPARDARLGAGATLPRAPGYVPEGRVVMACGRGGYVGLVRLEDGRLDAAAALDRGAVRAGGLGAAVARILREAGIAEVPGLADAPWRGTPPLTRRARAVAAERLFAAGDAAAFAEPFTGEGIAWALHAAEVLAPLAAQAARATAAGPWDLRWERAWERTWRREVLARQRSCRLLARGLRRPGLVSAAVVVLAGWPGLAAPLLRRLGVQPGTHAARDGRDTHDASAAHAAHIAHAAQEAHDAHPSHLHGARPA